MISNILEQLKNASVEERIMAIEAILQSLKSDMAHKQLSQPLPGTPKRAPFGFMKETGEILEDVVAPALPESAWDVLQ